MTPAQRATIELLRSRGYRVHVVRRISKGRLLIRLPGRLLTRNIPIHIYPDGRYDCPWYNSHNPWLKEHPEWQNSPS